MLTAGPVGSGTTRAGTEARLASQLAVRERKDTRHARKRREPHSCY